ncbi:hypothetical protein V1512DRAFT_264557 [Lipomyces arxii]|uniref:uncharacterized protein n=1 Tax=Lipomyces arxii TaxID=56418 RepID=UPI0034CFDA06
MPSPEFIAKPPDGFSVLSIVRGFQLTFLGAYRTLQNPNLFREKYYRQAAYAIAISLIIQFIIYIPIWIAKLMLSVSTWMVYDSGDNKPGEGSAKIFHAISFWENNLVNLSGLLIGLVRYLRPEMDIMFMESIRFIDDVYFKMHPLSLEETKTEGVMSSATKPSERTRFYAPLSLYSTDSGRTLARARMHSKNDEEKFLVPSKNNAAKFVSRYFRRSIISVVVYVLSMIPYLGKVVLPVVSFLSFKKTVGTLPAAVVFSGGMFVPKQWLTVFLAGYWGGRSLCRELLIPYFSRLPFTPSERAAWFRAREGVLFGFGFGFHFILKIPYVGILMYGIAEASAAYLITKITDPPPSPTDVLQWTKTQTTWNQREQMLQGKIVEGKCFQPIFSKSKTPGAWVEEKKK